MTSDPGAAATDAELVLAAAAGDTHALGAIYDRYADRLHDFCVGMLRDRDAAADCVQDTFCAAAINLARLREPEKLRPWLYAIARNETMRRIRERKREWPAAEVPEVVATEEGPDVLAARSELADLVAAAAGGLSDRDRAVLDLTYHQGLDGPELAVALGVSATAATKMVQRLRGTVERSLGALLVARQLRHDAEPCVELAAMLDGWDGHFTVLIRKRVSRHIEACARCDGERRRRVDPRALLGASPVFVPAPPWLRERTLAEIELTCACTPLDRSPRATARLLAVAGAASLALGVLTTITVISVGQAPQETPVTPADAEATSTVSHPPGGLVGPPRLTTTTSNARSTTVRTTTASVAPRMPEPVGPSASVGTLPHRPERVDATQTDAPQTATSVVTSNVVEPSQDSTRPSTAEPQTTPPTVSPTPPAPEPVSTEPAPTVPVHTVPRGPIATLVPDIPVITTVAPIG
jgi:RNA polymerase sigma factor (sigma-70 family)